MAEQQDRKQIIIEGLLNTLGYREQLINELQNENIALKARAELAERRVKILLEKIDGYEAIINKLKNDKEMKK